MTFCLDESPSGAISRNCRLILGRTREEQRVLRLEIVTEEEFDSREGKFVSASSTVIWLEHSLLSLSKWESEWEIPFLSTTEKTLEQTVSYIRFMMLGDEDPEKIIPKLKKEHLEAINDYINKKMTATSFPNMKQDPQQETVTAELVYYWMIALGVPFECENWHFNRLLTLIRVCNVKNSKPDKVNRRQSAADRKALNEARRAQWKTRG